MIELKTEQDVLFHCYGVARSPDSPEAVKDDKQVDKLNVSRGMASLETSDANPGVDLGEESERGPESESEGSDIVIEKSGQESGQWHKSAKPVESDDESSDTVEASESDDSETDDEVSETDDESSFDGSPELNELVTSLKNNHSAKELTAMAHNMHIEFSGNKSKTEVATAIAKEKLARGI